MQAYYDGVESGAFGVGVMDFWHDAVHHVGSGQIAHLKHLQDTPRQDKLFDEPEEKYERIAVFAAEAFLLAYSYAGKKSI